jgi:hypothetical protein
MGAETRSPPNAIACLVALGLFALSCGDDETNTHRNRGYACIMLQEERPASFCNPIDVPADEPLFVFVDFQHCPYDTSGVHMSCSALREGSTITVSAKATGVPDGSGSSVACPANSLETVCELEPLPAGMYELRYGKLSFDFDVPSTTAQVCAASTEPGTDGRRAPQCCDTDADCPDGRSCEEPRCEAP